MLLPKNRRIKQREREQRKRKEERLNRKNEFGMTDETPWEAVEKIRKGEGRCRQTV